MEQEFLKVSTGRSIQGHLGNLVVSARRLSSDGAGVEFVIGRPGFTNVARVLKLGDAVLFETPDDGLLEIRYFAGESAVGSRLFTVLVTKVSPRRGIAGGLSEADPSNLPFTPEELERVRASLDSIRLEAGRLSGVSSEQLDLIFRKLAEIQEASERLGRKDWIMLTAGTLTNLIVAAALSPAVARMLLGATNTALQWLFPGAMRLLE